MKKKLKSQREIFCFKHKFLYISELCRQVHRRVSDSSVKTLQSFSLAHGRPLVAQDCNCLTPAVKKVIEVLKVQCVILLKKISI